MNQRIKPSDVGRDAIVSSRRGIAPLAQRSIVCDRGAGINPCLSFRNSLKAVFVVLMGTANFFSVGMPVAGAAPASLTLPQSTAFAILGHSCGGIQEKAYATGFQPVTGYPAGTVYIQTRCGGSGRGGGYHSTTYSAWVGATWNFSANLVSCAKLLSAPAVNPTFSATDMFGDLIYNNNGLAYLTVPVPLAPAEVAANQSGDQAAVSWTPDGANPAAISSSTLIATDLGSSAILTTTVNGPATNGLVGPLQPQTTYDITVVNTTIGGSSPASAPVNLRTAAATVAPSAPTGVKAAWASPDPTGATNTILASWSAAVPGDSPVDEYRVTVNGSDGAGSFTHTVSGANLTAQFSVGYTPNWTLTVQAHNAAGWGPWSTPFTLGGL